MAYKSLPGLDEVASTYAPYFGALVLLRLHRARACQEDFYMPPPLLRPPSTPPHSPISDKLLITIRTISIIITRILHRRFLPCLRILPGHSARLFSDFIEPFLGKVQPIALIIAFI